MSVSLNTNLEKIQLPSFRFGRYDTCIYCGDTATSDDHIIPWSYQTIIQTRHKNAFGPIVRACGYCNSRLNDRIFDSFSSRCQYAQTGIELAAKAIHWSMAQISELDYPLQQYILFTRSKRLWLRARADWFQSLTYYENIQDLLITQYLQRGHEQFCKYLYDYFNDTIWYLKEREARVNCRG